MSIVPPKSSRPPTDGEGPGERIKGAAFRELLEWYRTTRGEAELQRLFEALPSEVAEGLDPSAAALGILASTWYPSATAQALLDGMLGGLDGRAREALLLEGSQAVMASTLSGVYRTLFRWMASPERYARYAAKLWRSYHESGDFEVTMEGPGHSVTTVRRWSAHTPAICELNVGAAIAIYEAMGCADVSCTRTACVGTGADACRYEVRWSA